MSTDYLNQLIKVNGTKQDTENHVQPDETQGHRTLVCDSPEGCNLSPPVSQGRAGRTSPSWQRFSPPLRINASISQARTKNNNKQTDKPHVREDLLENNCPRLFQSSKVTGLADRTEGRTEGAGTTAHVVRKRPETRPRLRPSRRPTRAAPAPAHADTQLVGQPLVVLATVLYG